MSHPSSKILYLKLLIIFSLLVSSLVLLNMCSPKQSENTTDQTPTTTAPELVTVSIPVEGMTCAGCEFTVESAVRKKAGIDSVKADSQKDSVFVQFDKSSVTIDELVATINETGYKATKP